MKKNVLIFPCGSEVGLEIYRSLEYSKDFNILGGSSVNDHGRFVFSNYIDGIPFVDDKNFIEKINDIVKTYNVDYIFPAHDSVVLKLKENAKKIKAEIIAPPLTTCQICRSKKKTYDFFKEIIKIPVIYKKSAKLKFPVFIKPDVGQGSKGSKIIKNYKELEYSFDQDKSILIMEYLPGKEYTVDCFTNKDGELLYAQGRERRRILNGISVNSIPIFNKDFIKIAQKINNSLKFRGAWFFQLKINKDEELTLLEVAPRIAGTMGLSRIKGVNLPLLSLYDRMNLNVSIINNNFKVEVDRALHSKYRIDIKYKNVYVDFDDTMIVDDKVNKLLMSFLYQCQNENKKIYLITKHKGNLNDSLNKYNIPIKLFDQIIHISDDQDKAYFIKNNSIFIDDSFSERKNAFLNKKSFYVFSLSEIEALIL